MLDVCSRSCWPWLGGHHSRGSSSHREIQVGNPSRFRELLEGHGFPEAQHLGDLWTQEALESWFLCRQVGQVDRDYSCRW